MFSLNLWDISHTPHGVMFDVSVDDPASKVHQGTLEWIRHCLEAFEVDVPIQSWSITAGRTFYYHGEHTRHVWEDRWTSMWQVTVQTTQPLELPPLRRFAPRCGTHYIDQT
jgi:hypothetical protein